MRGTEPQRVRRKWFEPDTTNGTSTATPGAPGSNQWSRPVPPATEQQQAGRPRTRQLNARKTALPPEARAKRPQDAPNRIASEHLTLEHLQRKPQPPSAPCKGSSRTARRNTQDVAHLLTELSKLDQNPGKQPRSQVNSLLNPPAGSSSASDAPAIVRSQLAWSRTPSSAPLKACGASSRFTSKAALVHANSGQARIPGANHSHQTQPCQQQDAVRTEGLRHHISIGQQLKVTLELLQQQQQQELAAEPAVGRRGTSSSPANGRLSSNINATTAGMLRVAQQRVAATAAAALQDVLLLDRASQLLEQFWCVQGKSGAAESAAQQVQCIDAFMAASGKVQQLMSSLSRRQQVQQQSIVLGAASHPQQSLQQQQQLFPASSKLSTPRTPTAAQDAGKIMAVDQRCPWSGDVTMNALYVSTPSTCYGGSTSPSQTADGTATVSPLQPDTQGNSRGFTPLQTALKAVRPAQQQRQQSMRLLTSKQQPAATLQLLTVMQEELLQWFVQYVQGLGSITPGCRGECMELLKAVGRAQEWAKEQLPDTKSRANTADHSPASASCKNATSSSTGLRSSSRSNHCSTGRAAGTKGDMCSIQGSVRREQQFAELHTVLRKKLTHFGYLRCQLPAA